MHTANCPHGEVTRTESDAEVCTSCGLVLDRLMLEDELGGDCHTINNADYALAREAQRILRRLGPSDAEVTAYEAAGFRRHRLEHRRHSRRVAAAALLRARHPDIPPYRIRLAADVSVSDWSRICLECDLETTAESSAALAFEADVIGARRLQDAAASMLGDNQCRPLDSAASLAVRDAALSLRSRVAEVPRSCWDSALATLELDLQVAFCAGSSRPNPRAAHLRERGCEPAACSSCCLEAERLQAVWHLHTM